MAVATKLTPEQFAAMGDAANGFDLVNGELRAIPMSNLSSTVASELHGHLWSHVRNSKLGRTFAEGTAFRCFPDDPDRIRKSDVSFISTGRLGLEEINDAAAYTTVPDFVCEVVSPSDTVYGVAEKRAEWLGAGVKLYWEIDPVRRTVNVYTQDVPFAQFRDGDVLKGEPVIPGFYLRVADLFPQA